MLSVSAIAALKDNYIWALRRNDHSEVVVVDPGETEPVMRWLAAHGLELGAILVTHHHWDHTNGINGLRERWPVDVYGPAQEQHPIAALSHPLNDGEEFQVNCLDARFSVMDIPGHTLGHIALQGEGAVFCGDTLFSAGCGRLFEGTAAQMHASLSRLAALPGHTHIYCGHEYTESNLAFALAVEPENQAAREHLLRVRETRGQQQPSLPSTIEREREINPFLRCAQPAVQRAACKQAGRSLDTDVDVFAALRAWKDNFQPSPVAP